MFQPDLTEVTYTFPPASLASVSQVLPLASGTCNLTIGGSTADGTVGYTTTNQSIWQRFGDIVRIRAVITVASVTVAPTGNAVLRGLPFAPRTAAGSGGGGVVNRRSGTLSAASQVHVQPGASDVFFGDATGGTSAAGLTTGFLIFNFEYAI
jgi:hypothetical protein